MTDRFLVLFLPEGAPSTDGGERAVQLLAGDLYGARVVFRDSYGQAGAVELIGPWTQTAGQVLASLAARLKHAFPGVTFQAGAT